MTHKSHMLLALEQARMSPPCPPKFCVGAVLVDGDTNDVLASGYYQEFARGSRGPEDPGTIHAEHACLIKLAQKHGIPETDLGSVLPPNAVFYTTMEPCSERSEGRTCVDRILQLGDGRAIKAMYVGVRKPDAVGESKGVCRLEEAGVQVVWMDDDHELREQILEITCAGHSSRGGDNG
ncbi:cytidine deaminase-like protein [Bombardia bombarda]|uniref:Cytidine deaminase-like protein n=1 Tax=Bombardia bombarda TaxID=252184 RepID=A0AA39WAQ5_9PEZI|nr:cytidine deaminase-like protein [Bombardia bombarda]